MTVVSSSPGRRADPGSGSMALFVMTAIVVRDNTRIEGCLQHQ